MSSASRSPFDLAISNTKLRDRAARLVAEVVKCDYTEAVERLQRHDWNLRATLQETGDGLLPHPRDR